MDERWVNRSPETMLETFHWFRGEGFGLIVEDLLRCRAEPCVIVEGFRRQCASAPGSSVGFLGKLVPGDLLTDSPTLARIFRRSDFGCPPWPPAPGRPVSRFPPADSRRLPTAQAPDARGL